MLAYLIAGGQRVLFRSSFLLLQELLVLRLSLQLLFAQQSVDHFSYKDQTLWCCSH